ncbi:protein of unknown function [Aminobacter niigataensis]|nr:protein of unknown function [Aminobacter niigataensis]
MATVRHRQTAAPALLGRRPDLRDRRHSDVRTSAVEPQLTDTPVIDGAERVTTNLTPIPPTGTVMAWKAWCAA